jgi:hypothetical protein
VTDGRSPEFLAPEERVAVFDLGEVMTKHYQGDDSDVKVLLGGILQAFAGMRVEEYQAAAHAFLHQGRHPTLGAASTASRPSG